MFLDYKHRIINDRIEKSINYKGKMNWTYWGKGEGFALHLYHGNNVGRTGIVLANPPTTPIQTQLVPGKHNKKAKARNPGQTQLV